MKGASLLTGRGHLANQQRYVRALLLNNELLNKEATSSATAEKEEFFKHYFIREWRHYYLSDISQIVNAHRIVRYRYCYETILPALEAMDRKMMECAIKDFEERVGVSLEEYLHVITGLFERRIRHTGQRITVPLTYYAVSAILTASTGIVIS
jgi:hypothetical protein